MKRSTLGLIVALGCYAQSAAAIISIENLNAQPTRIGWSGNAEVGAEARFGNSERQAIRLGGRMDWFGGEDTAFAVAGYQYGESKGIKDADSLFSHFRYIDAQTRTLATEYWAQFEQNEFRRLSERDLFGAGLRFTVERPEQRQQHAFAVGVFHSHERFEALAGRPETASEESALFGNFYWVFKYEISPTSSLANTLYWQPALSGRDGFRALETFVLRVKINGDLGLRVALNVEHESEPQDGVKATDTSFTTSLSYEF